MQSTRSAYFLPYSTFWHSSPRFFLFFEFLKKPPKRQYPDYYQIIQKPIALEDIKKQLDNNAYQTLEEVRADFELFFINAKTYNMKESEIWKDAKDLLVSKLNYSKK